MTKHILSKMYILAGIMLPILFAYTTPVKGLTYGDAFLLFAIGCMLLQCSIVEIQNSIFYIMLYIIGVSFYVIFFESVANLHIMTTGRYLIYLIYILFMPMTYEHKEYAIRIYKKVCTFAALILVIQFVALNTIGYAVPGVVRFLPLTDENLYDYSYAVFYTNSRRCMSLFGEPSHYAMYVLPCLAFCLLRNKRVRNKDLCLAGIISLTIVMSSTFTGIFAMIFVWGFWIVQNVVKKYISLKLSLIVTFSVIAFFSLLLNTKLGNYLLNGEIYKSQSTGRFEGYTYLMNLDMSNTQILLGHGMDDIGSNGIYLAGWARLVYYYGIIGATLYTICLWNCTMKNKMGRTILLLLFVIMIGSEANFMPMFVTYMLMVIVFSQEPILTEDLMYNN